MVKTPNRIYRNRILEIIQTEMTGTPESIRNEYQKIYLESIAWLTIKRHLDSLYNDNIIDRKLLTKGIKRNIIIYRILKVNK